MTDSTDLVTQLSELAVELTSKVAELLAYAAKDLPPEHREKIYTMLEDDLPTVVINTLMKTDVLHTKKGIDHLKENLDTYAHQFSQRFIKNTM